jgi:hypothetical protein
MAKIEPSTNGKPATGLAAAVAAAVARQASGNSSPSPEKEKRELPGRDGRPLDEQPGPDGRLDGSFPGTCKGLVADVARFIGTYVVLPPAMLLVIAAWIVAAWLSEIWDRFPHLAITSPEKRCAKTRLLQLLELITPNAYLTTSISTAATYRLIASKQRLNERLTLLVDEAQSLARHGCESSETLRELLNSAIDRDAKIIRCAGRNRDKIEEFCTYCPKVIAKIGNLDSVLGDRCLPVRLERKTAADRVDPYRSRVVEPLGKQLAGKLEKWAKDNGKKVAGVYDTLEPFPIQNDRMAELLLPLQAVLTLAGPEGLPILKGYADDLDERDRQAEQKSPGVLLLTACQEIFGPMRQKHQGHVFVPTALLISELIKRTEEPWSTYSRGEPINPKALGRLLRPYGIRSDHNKDRTARGYLSREFEAVFNRYIPERSVHVSEVSNG